MYLPMLVVSNAFPELNLDAPKKVVSPRGHWKNISNQRQFLDHFAERHGIHGAEDWYRVTLRQLYTEGGNGLLSHHGGSLIQALRSVYPQYSWTPWVFSAPHQVHKGKSRFSKAQYFLFQQIRTVSNGDHNSFIVQVIS